MLVIDFNKKFFIDIKKSFFADQDDFLLYIEFFKKIFFSYEASDKNWYFDSNRIDEVCLWFSRNNFKYTLTDKAHAQIEVLKTQFTCERVIDRRTKFDVCLFSPETKILDFQIDAINWFLKRNVALNFSDTGAGKTIMTIGQISQMFYDKKIDACFLGTPGGTQYNWKKYFLMFSTLFKEDDFEIVSNENKDKIFENCVDKKIIIFPMHLLKDMMLSYKKGYKFGASAKLIRWKDGAYCDINKVWKKENIACVIDESHLIKAPKSVKTKALLAIKKYFKFRLLLSATPNITKIEDIYSQFKFLDHSLIPMSEKAFRLWLSDEIDSYFDFNILKYNQHNVEILRSRYPLVMYQADVVMSTKKETIPIYVDMHKDQKKLYQLICQKQIDDLYEEYDVIYHDLLENKLHQICAVIDCPETLLKNNYKDPEITNLLKKWDNKNDPKLTFLKSKLEDYIENRDEKVIVFASSPDVLDILAKIFNKYNPLVIHGSLQGIKDTGRDRTEKEELFNNDPKYKLMLLSSHTSSRSINLQKMCHRIIYYNVPLDPEEFRQGASRTHRITSTVDTIVELIIMDNTYDVTRFERAENRVQLNDSSMKELTQEKLKNLLLGITK